jgi:hypothetical protein
MKCSICKIEGHNKRSCKKIVVDVENKDVENELKVTRKKIYKKVSCPTKMGSSGISVA